MTHLVAVAALNVGHVLGRGALLRHVALLTTVAAALGTGLGTVLREVTHCDYSQFRDRETPDRGQERLTLVALAALDVGSRAGLLTVGSLVATLAAVLAGKLVDARDGACRLCK